MTKTQEKPTPKIKLTPAQRQIRSILRRALREMDIASGHYKKADEALQIAQNYGLKLNTPVQIGDDRYELIVPDGKWVPFKRIALHKMPKTTRKPKEQASVQSPGQIT